ncbi:MAG TPA: hypothetical protein VF596_02320 [Pyrinomonadaceae bacterium]|jgi:hypothetical protein
MKKQTKLKYIWIALNFLLLALPVFVPSISINVIGICLTIMFLLSSPLNLPFVWLFFYANFFSGTIGSMYLILFAFSVLAYIQWFIVMPRFVRFAREKLISRNIQIALSAKGESVKNLSDAKAGFYSTGYRKNWYDEQKRSPLERIIENKNE